MKRIFAGLLLCLLLSSGAFAQQSGQEAATVEKQETTAFSYTNAKDRTYYLHFKDTVLKNSGKTQRIYFFAKDIREGTFLTAVPDGYMVKETKNGLPVLKKKKKS